MIDKKRLLKIKIIRIVTAVLSLLAIAFMLNCGMRHKDFKKVQEMILHQDYVGQNLSENEEIEFNSWLDEKYPVRTQVLRNLPYNVNPFELDVKAGSAIVVDTNNGCVLYEKNADEVIPPASMTKLFVMYVVFKEIASGKISLTDVVPLPPECWACNMPPHSSLMFLGKDQTVTVEELLTGMAVCSGNDGAYAIANYVSGGMDKFIERMNSEAALLGLKNTHFVEASGYSELNTTTAREMAAFARTYVHEFPESVEKFHSVKEWTYPQEHNRAPADKGKKGNQDFSKGFPQNIWMGITQKNTNPLLDKLEGCNGLKTGYIDESGYNLALTCSRKGMNVLSVTMRGPGKNANEGNQGRVHDGTLLMEWAYGTFHEFKMPSVLRTYYIPSLYTKKNVVALVPAFKPEALNVPVALANDKSIAALEVSVVVHVPEVIRGGVEQGKSLGLIDYMMNGVLLESIPLVVEESVADANPWNKAADWLSEKIF